MALLAFSIRESQQWSRFLGKKATLIIPLCFPFHNDLCNLNQEFLSEVLYLKGYLEIYSVVYFKFHEPQYLAKTFWIEELEIRNRYSSCAFSSCGAISKMRLLLLGSYFLEQFLVYACTICQNGQTFVVCSWITFFTLSCLLSYSFRAILMYQLMWFTVSSLTPHSLYLRFSYV